MSDESGDAMLDSYLRNALRRQRRGERVTIELGPHTALTLAGLIQFAQRWPEVQDAEGVFEPYLDQLRQAFADEPAALALIDRRNRP